MTKKSESVKSDNNHKEKHRTTVIVIGGGASGMMAAIMAARYGASVTILEQNEKNGKKINATGNGRCNFTNSYWDEQVIRGTDPSFSESAFKQFSIKDTLDFFRNLGVEPVEKNGYYYPRSNQASAVSELMIIEARSLGIKLKTNEKVISIDRNGKLWRVQTEGWHYEAEKIIISMGSCASAIKGCDGKGYEIAKKLGHKIIKPLPALTGLKLKESSVKFGKWAGVRTEGDVTVLVDGNAVVSARGELQLTDYGISGIPVFQVSRYAIRALDDRKKVELKIDFYPDLSPKEFLNFITKRKQQHPDRTDEQLLLGIFPEKLAQVLAMWMKQNSVEKELLFSVKEGLSFQQAQVASGGVSTKEVSPETMESLRCPGLYFAGEILDIDGTCGGYNLQWAWSSGAVAGWHAAGKDNI